MGLPNQVHTYYEDIFLGFGIYNCGTYIVEQYAKIGVLPAQHLATAKAFSK